MLIPGIQGRWEYLRPTVDALAETFRVVTFSLSPLSSGRPHDAAFESAGGLSEYADQVRAALDAERLARAIVCGVSFGGLVALRFAATFPERTQALVLVSTPGPHFSLRARHRIYTRAPWLFGPLFLVEAPFRLGKEIAAALPQRAARWRFGWRQVRTLITAPVSLSHMAKRAELIGSLDMTPDCERISMPTLLVTGERHLDHVVPVDGASAYLHAIRGSRHTILERSGHLGSITRPHEFARRVREFVDSADSGHQRSGEGSSPPHAAA